MTTLRSDMAGRIDPAIRKRLEDEGTWLEFHELKRRLIYEGKDPDEAEAIALKKFLIPTEAAARRVTPPGSNRKDGMTTSEVKEHSAAFRKQTQEETRVPKKVFEGKQCSYREAVEWVAENLWIRAVKPGDAPSATAWGLLIFAREPRGSNRLVFWKDIHAKVEAGETKSDSEDGPFRDDGKEIIATIDALRAAGQ